MPPVCSNCGANDFVWANDLKTGGSLSAGTLSLRPKGELSMGTRICKSCGHADLFLKDPAILKAPHTWRPGEFVPIPPTQPTSHHHAHKDAESPAAAPMPPPPTPMDPGAPPAPAPSLTPPPPPPPPPPAPEMSPSPMGEGAPSSPESPAGSDTPSKRPRRKKGKSADTPDSTS